MATHHPAAQKGNQHQPPPQIEAFFTTDWALTPKDILHQYREQWAVETTIRDSYGFDGLGQEQCRKVERIMGANTLRLVMAAACKLWFDEHAEQRHSIELRRYQPWYRQKSPSQLDIVWACC